MIKKLVINIALLGFLAIIIFIISTQEIHTQNQCLNQATNKIQPTIERHENTKALLALVEKLNAQIDSIVYLLAIDIPKTDAFLETIEKRLNQIDVDAKAHHASLLIDTVKLSTLKETVLYYRSIVDIQKNKETRKLSA
ncbi:hypothetical protein JST56_00445 [Candidatus Dependentiae bacterium]|nr:hypothetical protein [Candidatus Dependentiae bacterium]